MFVLEASVFVALVIIIAMWGTRYFSAWQRDDQTAGERTRRWLETIDDTGPVAVMASRWNSTGDRCTLDLGEHGTLRIRCFWPRPLPVVAIRRAFFRNSVGWGLVVETPNGDPSTLWVWAADHRRGAFAARHDDT